MFTRKPSNIFNVIKHLGFKKSPWEEMNNKGDNLFSSFSNFSNKLNLNFEGKNFIMLVIGALLFLWLSSGIYRVEEGSQAIVQRLGKYVRKAYPGLNYRLPYPFEEVTTAEVDFSQRIEIGFRSGSDSKRSDGKNIAEESIMLTGDENIVDINCVVMWKIKDIQDYVFKVANPKITVKAAAESALREVIGNSQIAYAQTKGKAEIAIEVMKLTQNILDHYEAGINIEDVQLLKVDPPAEVIDAFRDVQTSKADKERLINQAYAYRNDILPRARGEAAKLYESAEAYKQEVVERAHGETKRFNSIYAEYKINKSLTLDRLYLDTIEKVLSNANKFIMPKNSNMLPLMDIRKNKEEK